MNNLELQAARKLLLLDVKEAAEEIGGVSARSWQYWESGRSPTPSYVERAIEDFLELRLALIDEIAEKIDSLGADQPIELPFYQCYEYFCAEKPDATKTLWRINQSVAALYYTEGLAKLVAPAAEQRDRL
jgi:hypothetical protein